MHININFCIDGSQIHNTSERCTPQQSVSDYSLFENMESIHPQKWCPQGTKCVVSLSKECEGTVAVNSLP